MTNEEFNNLKLNDKITNGTETYIITKEPYHYLKDNFVIDIKNINNDWVSNFVSYGLIYNLTVIKYKKKIG